ncbi:hypothetical protein, partial [Lentzea flava]|uniref:hypothetical protein n=1 Tax=Lentzea flava TaxID=103732 RepID=UPI0016702CB6
PVLLPPTGHNKINLSYAALPLGVSAEGVGNDVPGKEFERRKLALHPLLELRLRCDFSRNRHELVPHQGDGQLVGHVGELGLIIGPGRPFGRRPGQAVEPGEPHLAESAEPFDDIISDKRGLGVYRNREAPPWLVADLRRKRWSARKFATWSSPTLSSTMIDQ